MDYILESTEKTLQFAEDLGWNTPGDDGQRSDRDWLDFVENDAINFIADQGYNVII
jgi:hypothetical protein